MKVLNVVKPTIEKTLLLKIVDYCNKQPPALSVFFSFIKLCKIFSWYLTTCLPSSWRPQIPAIWRKPVPRPTVWRLRSTWTWSCPSSRLCTRARLKRNPPHSLVYFTGWLFIILLEFASENFTLLGSGLKDKITFFHY